MIMKVTTDMFYRPYLSVNLYSEFEADIKSIKVVLSNHEVLYFLKLLIRADSVSTYIDIPMPL